MVQFLELDTKSFECIQNSTVLQLCEENITCLQCVNTHSTKMKRGFSTKFAHMRCEEPLLTVYESIENEMINIAKTQQITQLADRYWK